MNILLHVPAKFIFLLFFYRLLSLPDTKAALPCARTHPFLFLKFNYFIRFGSPRIFAYACESFFLPMRSFVL